MNNQLIPKEKYSFFDKIRNFIFKITKRNQKIDNKATILDENTIIKELDFEKQIKVEIKDNDIFKRTIEKENFIKEIEKNPNIIIKLSNDRLDKLIEYYEDVTREKYNEIKRLQANLN